MNEPCVVVMLFNLKKNAENINLIANGVDDEMLIRLLMCIPIINEEKYSNYP